MTASTQSPVFPFTTVMLLQFVVSTEYSVLGVEPVLSVNTPTLKSLTPPCRCWLS